MTNLIEKLAVRSLVQVDGEFIFSKEKFTELIVQECADVILEWKSEPFPFDPETAAKLIKAHFNIQK